MLTTTDIEQLIKDEEIARIEKAIKKLAWAAEEWKRAPELIVVDAHQLACYLWSLEKRIEILETKKKH